MSEFAVKELVPAGIVIVNQNDGTPYDPWKPLQYFRFTDVTASYVFTYQTSPTLASNIGIRGLDVPLDYKGHPTDFTPYSIFPSDAKRANIPPVGVPVGNTNVVPVPLRLLKDNERVFQTISYTIIQTSEPGDENKPPANQTELLNSLWVMVKNIHNKLFPG